MTENNHYCRTDNIIVVCQFDNSLHQEQTPRIWGKLLCLEKKYDVSYNQENYHN